MLEWLKLTHVGPAPELEMGLSPRINLLTGDNGLGKSFILDIAWWSLTRTWANLPAHPHLVPGLKPSIEFHILNKTKPVEYHSTFDREKLAWSAKAGKPSNPALVLYAQVDGGFSVWDPARNYWRKKGDHDIQDLPSAYLFHPKDVWDGLELNGNVLCNGLLRDWASWQKEKGHVFNLFKTVLKGLSPASNEILEPGDLTRISLADVRDIPTLKMPYGKEVAILHASAAIKRIIALGYLLVWTWQEHLQASKLLGQEPVQQIIFLIDEIEAHLHPKWQRVILRSLLDVISALTHKADTKVQLMCVTHSPLVLASVEPYFDTQQDAVWNFELIDQQVRLCQEPWSPQGDVVAWLTSDIFGLQQARSIEAERAIAAAETYMMGNTGILPLHLQNEEQIHQELLRVIPGHDPFWPRWVVTTKRVLP